MNITKFERSDEINFVSSICRRGIQRTYFVLPVQGQDGKDIFPYDRCIGTSLPFTVNEIIQSPYLSREKEIDSVDTTGILFKDILEKDEQLVISRNKVKARIFKRVKSFNFAYLVSAVYWKNEERICWVCVNLGAAALHNTHSCEMPSRADFRPYTYRYYRLGTGELMHFETKMILPAWCIQRIANSLGNVTKIEPIGFFSVLGRVVKSFFK